MTLPRRTRDKAQGKLKMTLPGNAVTWQQRQQRPHAERNRLGAKNGPFTFLVSASLTCVWADYRSKSEL